MKFYYYVLLLRNILDISSTKLDFASLRDLQELSSKQKSRMWQCHNFSFTIVRKQKGVNEKSVQTLR